MGVGCACYPGERMTAEEKKYMNPKDSWLYIWQDMINECSCLGEGGATVWNKKAKRETFLMVEGKL